MLMHCRPLALCSGLVQSSELLLNLAFLGAVNNFDQTPEIFFADPTSGQTYALAAAFEAVSLETVRMQFVPISR